MAISAPDDHGSRQPAGTMAGRPRRPTAPMTRTRVDVLRGTRTGALLATIALVALAARFLTKDIIVSGDPLATIAWFVLLTLVVWAIGVVLRSQELSSGHQGNRVTAPAIIAVLSVVALGACICSSVELASESGFLLGHPVAIGAACLSFGALAITDLLLRTHPARHRRSAHDIARWRPLPSADTSRTATALTGLITLTLALAVALTPVWAARPIQRTAPEPSQIPAVPATVAGEPAWAIDLDEDIYTITVGAAGPVLVTGAEIRGLDPADGSTRWTYHRPNAELLSLGDHGKIITGPDHRYAAFVTETPGSSAGGLVKAVERAPVTVLDTLTGRVVAERLVTRKSVYELGPVQLTDTAALIGTEAIDLTTGKTLWTLPESEDAPDYAGPAGHSTFILHREVDRSVLTASIVLAPQDDPNRRTVMENVSLNDHYFSPLVIDGWTIQYTEKPTYDDGGPAVAINIDEVAAAGGTDGAQRIDLGQTTGPDYRRSRTSLIATALDSSVTRSTRPATVFDPATRTTSPAERSTTVDTARLDVTSDQARRERVLQVHMTSPDGPVTADVAVTDDEFEDLYRANRSNRPDTQFPYFQYATVLAAPGAVLVHVELTSYARPTSSRRLYAIR